jgi:hypothetical protein
MRNNTIQSTQSVINGILNVRTIAIDGKRTSQLCSFFADSMRGLYHGAAAGLALLTGYKPAGFMARAVMCDSCRTQHHPRQWRRLPVVVVNDAGRVCVG